MTNKTGQRIHFFRKRANMSQLELETAIDAAPGSISRIESGKTNPSKETLVKVSSVLNMNQLEKEYTYGNRMEPVSTEEVNKAIDSIEEFFKKPWVFAYLIDDRHRVWAISRSMKKLLRLENLYIRENLGKTLIEIVLDEKNSMSFLDPHTYENTITNLLNIFYAECGFMLDDPIIREVILQINKNEFAKQYWNEISSQPPITVQDYQRRKVSFKVANVTIPIHYASLPLMSNIRFLIIEYSVN